MTLRLEPLPADRLPAWRSRTRGRLIRLLQESGFRPGPDAVEHADAIFGQLMPGGAATEESAILRVFDAAGAERGFVWLSLPGERAFLVDVQADDDLAPADREALADLIEDAGRRSGAVTLAVTLFPQDVATRRLLAGRGFAASSVQMLLEPLPERVEEPGAVRVVGMTPERFERFAAESERGFAEELAGTGRMTPADAAAEARRQFAKELPEGLSSRGQALFVAEAEGVEVGILWLGLRTRAGTPHAFILDVAVHEAHRRRGYGREIMLAAERESAARGAGSIGLHVFAANAPAVALYERLGYRRVEELALLRL
ncbi:GNAT family N-acetyltransferase [Microbacterium sp. CIAB417]|uniref:GNAT family N-acetyltransferase n=1 Tax=Microbacterium sp. CIAB417 TaxID=2860287 RepID=UPI001FAD4ED9|nr:GNAT family N-acetyltransferase [Microbacterium sp. CIAB417]